jgi:hypothetical protein
MDDMEEEIGIETVLGDGTDQEADITQTSDTIEVDAPIDGEQHTPTHLLCADISCSTRRSLCQDD